MSNSYGRASLMFRELSARASRKKAVEKIRGALARHKGRIDRAASSLKVSPRTLSRWLKDNGLQKYASGLRAENSIPGPRP